MLLTSMVNATVNAFLAKPQVFFVYGRVAGMEGVVLVHTVEYSCYVQVALMLFISLAHLMADRDHVKFYSVDRYVKRNELDTWLNGDDEGPNEGGRASDASMDASELGEAHTHAHTHNVLRAGQREP